MHEAQKLALLPALNRFAEKKVIEAIQIRGKSCPCSVVSVDGPIVTVKFEITGFQLPNVTVPINGSEYIRLPIQPGCKGVVFPVDFYLGGISGLGGGVADLSMRGSLSTLMFFPCGNANWSASENSDAVVIWGPDGVIIRDENNTHSLTVSPTENRFKGNVIIEGELLLQGGIKSDTGAVYTGELATTGNIVANKGLPTQVGLTTHGHPGNNLPPNPGT